MSHGVETWIRVVIAAGLGQVLMTFVCLTWRLQKNQLFNRVGWIGWIGMPLLLMPVYLLPDSMGTLLWTAGAFSSLDVATGCTAIADKAASLLTSSPQRTKKALVAAFLWVMGTLFVTSTCAIFLAL